MTVKTPATGPITLAQARQGTVVAVDVNAGHLAVAVLDPDGNQIGAKLLDSSGSPPGAGALFGLTPAPGMGLYYVDDATNTLNLFK